MKTMVVVLLLLYGCVAMAQEAPKKGGHEVQVWAGGGYSVSGGTSHTGIFNLGLRYGWVLTDQHGPGFLKGSFEYAMDAVPMFLIFQPANTARGIGLNPLALKWNFAPRRSWAPYFELGGGTLFTNHDVPAGISSVNFTSGAALGFYHLGNRMTWNLEARYLHISNAGLTRLNPGLNTVQVRFGLGRFRK
jgi:lipid A 3-O-deacylase